MYLNPSMIPKQWGIRYIPGLDTLSEISFYLINNLTQCILNNKMLDDLDVVPPDFYFGTAEAARNDKDPNKIDLSIGIYRNSEGNPQLLKAARLAKIAIVNDPDQNEEYLPLLGHDLFVEEAANLLFRFDDYTDEQYRKLRSRMLSKQTISGTGALFLGLTLLKRCSSQDTFVSASDPTWALYRGLVERNGFEYREYPYYNYETNTIDIDRLVETLENYPKGTVILLQTSCHNPCGLDLSENEWVKVLDVIKRKQHVPFLDVAYHGFASDDMNKEAYPIKLFCDANIDFLLAQSFSKIMSIYSARAGALHVVTKDDCDQLLKNKIISNLKQLGRSCYSNPPRHGAEIVYRILSNPDLRKTWLEELSQISQRVRSIRQLLYKTIKEFNIPGNWEHISRQNGLYTFLNIPEKIAYKLRESHVYIIPNSRVCVAGLNTEKVGRFVKILQENLADKSESL